MFIQSGWPCSIRSFRSFLPRGLAGGYQRAPDPGTMSQSGSCLRMAPCLRILWRHTSGDFGTHPLSSFSFPAAFLICASLKRKCRCTWPQDDSALGEERRVRSDDRPRLCPTGRYREFQVAPDARWLAAMCGTKTAVYHQRRVGRLDSLHIACRRRTKDLESRDGDSVVGAE